MTAVEKWVLGHKNNIWLHVILATMMNENDQNKMKNWGRVLYWLN